MDNPQILIDETPRKKEVLVRSALIFVEGNHTDNKGRSHQFPKEVVTTICNNTNEYIKRGGTVPILYDHNKTAKQVAGSIDEPLILRPVVESDLPNLVNGNRLGYLVGKLGIFSDDVKLKDEDAIRLFANDLARTISPGVDMKTLIIREVSIVPTPAIPGLSMYSTNISDDIADFTSASPYLGVYSLEEAIKEKQSVSSRKKEFIELAELLWDVLLNIRTQFYDTAEMVNLVSENLQQYIAKVLEMFNIDKELVDMYRSTQPNTATTPVGVEASASDTPNVVIGENNTNQNYNADLGNMIYFL